MKKSILLTRSLEENRELKEKLKSKELKIIECSLIKYELFPVSIEVVNRYDGLIITSLYAAKNLPRSVNSIMPLWVVGSKSARILSDKGYKIEACTSTALELRNIVLKEEKRKLLYLSGNYITVEMPYPITQRIFYNVSYLKKLSDEQIFALKKKLDYIILYSENCAKTLFKLLQEENLMNYLTDTVVIAISTKVGAIFKDNCKKLIIGDNAEQMLNFIE